MIGRVISSRYGVYNVVNEEGKTLEVKPRGIFRHQGKKVIVGDMVEIEEEEKTITRILDRKNELIRPSISNVDMAYVVMSCTEPDFSIFLIAKFFTYLSSHQIPSSLIITKMDTCKDRSLMEKWKEIFVSLGHPTYFLSREQSEDLASLKEALKGKVSTFLGQSGVGKSSLLNIIFPDWNLKIGEFSSSLGRGKHQTKEVLLLPFEGGFVADTPGFSSLDLKLNAQEISTFFPGFAPYIGKCYFKDCIHLHEKGCSLKEAIEKKEYNEELYAYYLQFIEETLKNTRRNG